MMAFDTELEARIIHVLGRLPAQIKIKRDQLTTFRETLCSYFTIPKSTKMI